MLSNSTITCALVIIIVCDDGVHLANAREGDARRVVKLLTRRTCSYVRSHSQTTLAAMMIQNTQTHAYARTDSHWLDWSDRRSARSTPPHYAHGAQR